MPQESTLPAHGRIDCDLCYRSSVEFDQTRREQDGWRITANPLAWGSQHPEVVVLGFSKGPNALGALASASHDEIPFSRQRTSVRKILTHIGLLPPDADMQKLISDKNGRFAWGSLIRCTVERGAGGDWRSSGGGMLDKFMDLPFGREVAGNCTSRFLGALPTKTKLVVLFGLGTNGNYVTAARRLIERARGGSWRTVNEVAYEDGKVMFVHVEHFAAQGRLIPEWLGLTQGKRSRLGDLARDAVSFALDRSAARV